MSFTLRCCCGGVAGNEEADTEAEAEELAVPSTNGGMVCRASGDMIIANEGESVCVALWPDGPEDDDEDEEEDEVGTGASGGAACVGV